MNRAGSMTNVLRGGTYARGLCIGIMSGLLWGINNFLFARGYAQLPITQITTGLDAFSLAVMVPVVCAAINDICAAAALLVFNGIRGVLSIVRYHLFTKAGFFVCLAALLGGPVGQSARGERFFRSEKQVPGDFSHPIVPHVRF